MPRPEDYMSLEIYTELKKLIGGYGVDIQKFESLIQADPSLCHKLTPEIKERYFITSKKGGLLLVECASGVTTEYHLQSKLPYMQILLKYGANPAQQDEHNHSFLDEINKFIQKQASEAIQQSLKALAIFNQIEQVVISSGNPIKDQASSRFNAAAKTLALASQLMSPDGDALLKNPQAVVVSLGRLISSYSPPTPATKHHIPVTPTPALLAKTELAKASAKPLEQVVVIKGHPIAASSADDVPTSSISIAKPTKIDSQTPKGVYYLEALKPAPATLYPSKTNKAHNPDKAAPSSPKPQTASAAVKSDASFLDPLHRELLDAAKNGDEIKFHSLIRDKKDEINLEISDTEGVGQNKNMTVLGYLANGGTDSHNRIAECLIEQGMLTIAKMLNPQNEYGMNLAYLAAQANNRKLFEIVLKACPESIHIVAKHGATPLFWAARNFAAGTNVPEWESAKSIMAMIKAQNPAQFSRAISAPAGLGYTPLHLIIRSGNEFVIKETVGSMDAEQLLNTKSRVVKLQLGSKLESAPDGQSIFHHAAASSKLYHSKSSSAVLKVLLNRLEALGKSAQDIGLNPEGHSVMGLAAKNGDVGAIQMLKEHHGLVASPVDIKTTASLGDSKVLKEVLFPITSKLSMECYSEVFFCFTHNDDINSFVKTFDQFINQYDIKELGRMKNGSSDLLKFALLSNASFITTELLPLSESGVEFDKNSALMVALGKRAIFSKLEAIGAVLDRNMLSRSEVWELMKKDPTYAYFVSTALEGMKINVTTEAFVHAIRYDNLPMLTNLYAMETKTARDEMVKSQKLAREAIEQAKSLIQQAEKAIENDQEDLHAKGRAITNRSRAQGVIKQESARAEMTVVQAPALDLDDLLKYTSLETIAFLMQNGSIKKPPLLLEKALKYGRIDVADELLYRKIEIGGVLLKELLHEAVTRAMSNDHAITREYSVGDILHFMHKHQKLDWTSCADSPLPAKDYSHPLWFKFFNKTFDGEGRDYFDANQYKIAEFLLKNGKFDMSLQFLDMDPLTLLLSKKSQHKMAPDSPESVHYREAQTTLAKLVIEKMLSQGVAISEEGRKLADAFELSQFLVIQEMIHKMTDSAKSPGISAPSIPSHEEERKQKPSVKESRSPPNTEPLYHQGDDLPFFGNLFDEDYNLFNVNDEGYIA